MSITKISLRSFRNHNHREVDFCKGLTLVWGENGSGKTSLLEAISLLSFGKSFRTHKPKDLIKDGEHFFAINGKFKLGGYEDKVNAQYNRDGNQKIKLNGKLISGRKELLGRNNVVILSPEEEQITKGPPRERRQFFDKVFSIVKLDYLEVLQKYNRILRQRNSALIQLKENKNLNYDLSQWNDQLVTYGYKLWKLRIQFLKRFRVSLKEIISNYDDKINIKIIYNSRQTELDDYKQRVLEFESSDIKYGRTTYGPHRDNIKIEFYNKDLRQYGSQGEHKITLIFIKLAEMIFIKSETKSYPILLLDDLFAKVDLDRSKKLVKLLNQLETDYGDPIQTIVTTTDIINIENSGLLNKDREIKTHNFKRT